MKKFGCFLYCIFFFFVSPAQEIKNPFFEIGRACPDFLLTKLFNYPQHQITEKTFKGKFLIIDFWGTFCVPCIETMPQLEILQKKFSPKLQVLMIGIDGEKKITDFFNRRKMQGKSMTLPCAVDDRLFTLSGLSSVPSEIWIDDKGIVRAITEAAQSSEKNINDFMSGNMLNMPMKKESRIDVDYSKPLLINGNGGDGSGLQFYSLLTHYKKGLEGGYTFPPNGRGTTIGALNCAIINLYLQAYGNEDGPFPINRCLLEMQDSSIFIYNGTEDRNEWYKKNAVCYQLIIPETKSGDLLSIMREDLYRYFRLTVETEKRKIKCFVLKKNGNFILKTAGARPSAEFNPAGISVFNKSIKDFLGMIGYYFQYRIFIDETGINGKIDIKLDALMTDLDEIRKSLSRYGLDLVEEERNVDMLVITNQR